MTNKPNHFIEGVDLSLSYDGRTVLKDASFFVDKGDYLCIVGENGSGKSTLAKAVLGLKKPAAGTLIFSDELKKSHVGYLPQLTAIRRDFPATVREVVLSGCLGKGRFSPFYSAEQKKRALCNMEKLGIADIASSCYRELSGGQQQRALLARALCAAEKLLVLDEPVSGLDPSVSSELYRIVKELCEKEKMTVIMITHDFSAAIKYANRILHLDRSVSFFGSTDDYAVSEAFKSLKGVSEND